ncbi:hypothetical protein ACF0H5_017474 [Mactra antiquata]
MLMYIWILYVSLAGTLGDINILIHQRQLRQNAEDRSTKLWKRGGHCDNKCLVEEMYNDVYMTFDKEHCHAFNHEHCSKSVVRKEQLCSSDDVTYPNYCSYISASCEYIMDHSNYDQHQIIHSITIKHLGPCIATTPQMTSPTPMQTTTPAVTLAHTVTSSKQTIIPLVTTTTAAAATTTTASYETTTTTGSTARRTTQSNQDILSQVFCSQKQSVTCSKEFSLVCGSNGMFYPNECEFTKAQCDSASLFQMDRQFCVNSGGVIG